MSNHWTPGYPTKAGYYDCKLEDSREEIVNYFPGGDSETYPYGETLDSGILAHRRIPGEVYHSPHA